MEPRCSFQEMIDEGSVFAKPFRFKHLINGFLVYFWEVAPDGLSRIEIVTRIHNFVQYFGYAARDA